jgi:catechol 2,3-dioxygenase-like lactoylglutathione lyase family enzyme
VRILRLDHVSVTTGDLDRSVRFYAELLGLPLRGRGEIEGPDVSAIVGMPGVRMRWAEVDLGDGRIVELLEYVSPAGTPLAQTTADPGAAHFGFEVDDIDAVHALLVGHGVTVRSAPVTLEDDDPAWRGVRVLYALDPDGFTVEFLQRPAADGPGRSG